jgi:predicted transcriptional regulator
MSVSTDLVKPFQIRAGRALLGWSPSDLANVAGVSLASVRRAEASAGDMIQGKPAEILAMLAALHKHTVVLVKDMHRFGVALETRE